MMRCGATAHKRGTERHLAEAAEVFEEVENSSVMQKLWESYRKKFSYAADLEWNIIMGAVRSLYALSEKESSPMKKHGHYCKVCGEYKANENFPAKVMRRTSVNPVLLCRRRSKRSK